LAPGALGSTAGGSVASTAGAIWAASGSGWTGGWTGGPTGGRGARIFEIGGKTERVSEPVVASAFFGRFSSINETVSGLGAGGVAGGSGLAGPDSFAFALLIGGTPVFLGGLDSLTVGFVSFAGFLVFAEIRSVVVLRAALL
jgi:hypothetical protein